MYCIEKTVSSPFRKKRLKPCNFHNYTSFQKEERERERESLTYQTNTSNTDSLSLIYYIYRKIPEPGPDRFYRLFSSVAYPFSYPFSPFRSTFSHTFQAIVAQKIFSEKSTFFSGALPFSFCNELLLTMLRAWPGGVFFIYGAGSLAASPRFFLEIRGPPGPSQRLKLSRRCRCVMPAI